MDETLRAASAEEIAEALAYALRYDGRRRVHQADSFMARVAAERLVKHLERSGFVLMKRPGGTAPTTAGMPKGGHRITGEVACRRIRN